MVNRQDFSLKMNPCLRIGEQTTRAPQGTISPGERFGLLIPQFLGIFKDVQSTRLYVNDDVFNENDYLVTDIDRINTRDTRYFYLETYLNTVPGHVGDGYTASDVGFKIF